MDLKQAIRTAIEEVSELFLSQKIDNVMLEEVDRDEQHNYLITVGFDRANTTRAALAALGAFSMPKERVYKVVKLDQGGGIINIKDRKLESK